MVPLSHMFDFQTIWNYFSLWFVIRTGLEKMKINEMYNTVKERVKMAEEAKAKVE